MCARMSSKRKLPISSKRKITKSDNPALNSSSIIKVNWRCLLIGCFHPQESSQLSTWNLWWSIWTIFTSAMKIKSLKINLRNCMKKSSLQQSKPTKCHTKCFCHRIITDQKSTTTYSPNKPRRTQLEIQSARPTKWSTFQWCQKCQRNCSSWCFTSTRVKSSSTWQLRNWWQTLGGITISFRFGWKETVRRISILTTSMRQEIITVTGLSWVWKKGGRSRCITGTWFRRFDEIID